MSQSAHLAELDGIGHGEWTTLYEFSDHANGSRYYFSALLPPRRVNKALSHVNGELHVGEGQPGFSVSHDGKGGQNATYERYGSADVEPIVFVRDFFGIRPTELEISEEFRHYHHLFWDRRSGNYLKIGEGGEEITVAEVSPKRIRVLTVYLRQFMAARGMALAIYFDHRADANIALEDAKAALPGRSISEKDRRYDFDVGSLMDNNRSFSRVIGKKIIFPPPRDEAGVWPFSERTSKFEDFIIGVGAHGAPILHTCDPDKLANYFGANEHAPHFLTPVWFKRDALKKYYDSPSKFMIEDGYLRCGSLWGLRMDNNLPDHVMVYLGDLGGLNHAEQIHWRQFNVTPSDRQPSRTNFQRAFLAEFADPTVPDLLFKQTYASFNEDWTAYFGWPLFRPLHAEDEHVIRQLRVPLSNETSEFETQLIYLAKLLVDSLNGAKFVELCGDGPAQEASISKLSRYLISENYPVTTRDVDFLRLLQRARSLGPAHTKGSDYDKFRRQLGLDHSGGPEVFRNLLAQAIQMLEGLTRHFLNPFNHADQPGGE